MTSGARGEASRPTASAAGDAAEPTDAASAPVAVPAAEGASADTASTAPTAGVAATADVAGVRVVGSVSDAASASGVAAVVGRASAIDAAASASDAVSAVDVAAVRVVGSVSDVVPASGVAAVVGRASAIDAVSVVDGAAVPVVGSSPDAAPAPEAAPAHALPSVPGVLRQGLLWLGGVGGLVVSVAVAVTIGPADISVPDVWSAVAAHLGWGEARLTPIRDGIVWNLRMPRTLLAAVCGAGLAVCGAVMQSLLRNPLADPFVLGVSSGASTGAVAVVVLGVGGGAVSVSAGAFVGALCSFALVLLLSHTLGGTTDRVVLSGVAAMQLFSALTSFVILAAGDAETTRGVIFWLLGSLSGVGWTDVWLCGAVLAAALLICLSHARTLDAFAFGQEAAATLGVRVARTRLVLLCTTALLTAALVSSAGAIGFVGLVLPHAARAIVGSGHARLLPVTALAGAVFVVWVDTLARTVLDPQEVPVGVVTSLIGVPAFVAVLYRTRRATA